jgi:hypothetical protein
MVNMRHMLCGCNFGCGRSGGDFKAASLSRHTPDFAAAEQQAEAHKATLCTLPKFDAIVDVLLPIGGDVAERPKKQPKPTLMRLSTSFRVRAQGSVVDDRTPST